MMLYSESAILDQNLHHLCYPQLMGQDGKVESWEEQHVNLHFRLANRRIEIFRDPEWDQVVQVAIRAEMASELVSDICVGLVEEHPYHCISTVSGDSLLYQCGKEDSHWCGSDK
jgi:hypothetical protein